MNIVVKNADFSEVKIGNVGELSKGSTLSKCYLAPNLLYINGGQNVVCFDISKVTGSRIKITSFAGSSLYMASFYENMPPQSDVIFENSTQVAQMRTFLGTLLSSVKAENQGLQSIIVEIPNGAKTIILNMGSSYTKDDAEAIALP